MGKTVQIDDDVVHAAEKLAAEQGTTLGQVISELARRQLRFEVADEEPCYRNGFRLLPRTGQIITSEMVRGGFLQ